MEEVSALQPAADDVVSASGLNAEQAHKVHLLNDRWNTLNIDVIEKELR